MKLTSQFLRFCAVGALCYLVGLALLTALTELVGLHYLASFAISFVVTGIFGFLLNGRISFGAVGAMDSRAAVRYLIVNATSLAANSLALAVLVEIVGIWYLAAVVLLTICNIPVNFVVHRLVTYRIHRVGTTSGVR